MADAPMSSLEILPHVLPSNQSKAQHSLDRVVREYLGERERGLDRRGEPQIFHYAIRSQEGRTIQTSWFRNPEAMARKLIL
jgi:hypothetical protein